MTTPSANSSSEVETVEKHAVKPSKRELEVEEWKECRTTIGRFDTLLVDLRKYGFTLITGLLTASSFWFSSVAPKQGVLSATEAGVALVLTVLVVALFVLDRSYEVLLYAAVERGKLLESTLQLGLSTELSVVAERTKTDTWASRTYALFIVAAQIPWVLSWLGLSASGLGIVLFLGVLGLMLFAWRYHRKTVGR